MSLKRRIPVKKIEVLMEIGRQEKRDELHSILLLAEECGGRVTPRDISEKLLLGRPESAARALIDRCAYYEILGLDGGLTDTGREALRNGFVFVPERGRYLVWYTDDPLIPQRLMDLQPVEETQLHDEVLTMRNPAQRHGEEEGKVSGDLPSDLPILEGKTFDLFGSGHGQILVKKFEPRVVLRRTDDTDILSATLRLSPNAPPTLSMEGKFQRILTPPQIEFSRTWIELLGPNSPQWDHSRNPPALRVGFDQMTESERGSFTMNLSLREPRIRNLGTFNPTVVEEVPIMPRTREDARSWAKWLLLRSINSYVSKNNYGRLVEQAVSQFPDYPGVELSSQGQLADELKEKRRDGRLSEQYWYVQAPLDLDEQRKVSQR